MTGRGKHKWTRTVKYEPNYFGKHGFHPVAESTIRAINVGELNDLSEKLLEKGLAKHDQKKIIIDLKALGYDKLLGKGKVSNPLVVRVEGSSKKAVEKLEAAGGRIMKLE